MLKYVFFPPLTFFFQYVWVSNDIKLHGNNCQCDESDMKLVSVMKVI